MMENLQSNFFASLNRSKVVYIKILKKTQNQPLRTRFIIKDPRIPLKPMTSTEAITFISRTKITSTIQCYITILALLI